MSLERLRGPDVVLARAADLNGEGLLARALQSLRVLVVDRGPNLPQEAQVALAGVIRHRLELVAQHRRQPKRDGGSVEHLEQRQIDTGHRLPQPFLAKRPGAEPLDVRHVRVQHERQQAGTIVAHAGTGVGHFPNRFGASMHPRTTSAPTMMAGSGAIPSVANVLNAAWIAITAKSDPVRS